MEIIVISEELAVLHIFIGPANLLTDEPAEIPEQLRIIDVVVLAFLEELNTSAHVIIAVAEVVEFDRNVVAQIPGLKFPERDKVRLQLGELLERGGKTGPVLSLLEIVGLFPEPVDGHAAEAERHQLDGLAGRIDV